MTVAPRIAKKKLFHCPLSPWERVGVREQELSRGKPVQVYVCVAHPDKIIGGSTFVSGDASAAVRKRKGYHTCRR